VAAVIFTLYRGVYVPRRNKYRAMKLAIAERFSDIENVQYVLISHLKTGLAIFSRAFTEIPIDETLVSGFLSAITSFGEELAGKTGNNIEKGSNAAASDTSGLEELSYQQFKIFNIDSHQIRTSLLLLKKASPTLKTKAHDFNVKFEEKYKTELEKWGGKTFPPGPIVELFEEVFSADLLYPHSVLNNKIINYKPDSKIEKMILREAATPQFNNNFRVRDMINNMVNFGIRDVDTFNAIHHLRNDGIVFAINPRTKYLIDQFQPVIDRLDSNDKHILLKIADGIQKEIELTKEFKTINIQSNIEKLKKENLVDNQLKVTQLGEVIGTLLKVVPNL
jgi:hypothetical protein